MSEETTRLDEIQSMFRNARKGAGASSDNEIASEMAANRQVNRRVASGGSLALATGRPKDPLWYWRQGNLPYNIWDDPMGTEMARVRELCRLLYVTHPLLGSAVDIYCRYPLAGMEVVCPKDKSVAEFHSELFIDDLDYENFLIDVGREYWLVGEGFPLASFNDLTGTFDSDEMQLPEDVNVINSPFSNEPRFEMALPFRIREILTARYPELEYKQLVDAYPEFLALNHNSWVTMSDRNRYMIPVSNKLMSHVMRRGDTFHDRGIPILMRAFRAVAQEEMLNAAQDSISQRLYTPLILARIGASAQDLGTGTAWIPQQGDLDDFTEDVNSALAADFRLITTHFAVNMQNVFGRESMPKLDTDFNRLEEKMLQAFGLSRTMLSGAGGGQTYAADALNRDLVTQLLMNYQQKVKRFFRHRAAVVAEAQGHYDFERKGGRLKPIMERVQETDSETGEIRFVERPKLLLPDLKIKAMNIKDGDQLSGLLEQFRQSGVPISQRTRLTNVPIDLDQEVEAVMDENVDQAIRAQEVRKRTYVQLKTQGLPIPEDLIADFQPKTIEAGGGTSPEDQLLDTVGDMDPVSPADALVGPGEDEEDGGDSDDDDVKAPAFSLERRNRTRPPESDEQRKSMPKAASYVNPDGDDELDRESMQVLTQHMEFVQPTTHRLGKVDEDGFPVDEDDNHIPLSDFGLTDDDRIPQSLDEFRAMGGVPVVGSYTTRHVGVRHPDFFYRRDEDS